MQDWVIQDKCLETPFCDIVKAFNRDTTHHATTQGSPDEDWKLNFRDNDKAFDANMKQELAYELLCMNFHNLCTPQKLFFSFGENGIS